MNIKTNKILVFLVLLVLLTSFTTILLHHHDDDQNHYDCGLCFLVKSITGFIVFASVIVGLLFSSRQYVRILSEKFNSFELISSLKDRSPPVLA